MTIITFIGGFWLGVTVMALLAASKSDVRFDDPRLEEWWEQELRRSQELKKGDDLWLANDYAREEWE